MKDTFKLELGRLKITANGWSALSLSLLLGFAAMVATIHVGTELLSGASALSTLINEER